MKNYFTPLRRGLALLVLAAGSQAAWAQGVTIGAATAPDPSAVLDIVSSSKGVLLPRVVNVTSIASPATGLIVYQTGGTAGYYYNAGTSTAANWKQLDVVGSAGDNLGNHVATQGLTGTGASIGTTVGLGIRADGGLNLGQNSTGNNLYIGFRAGESNLATGTDNLFMGLQAGRANTSGNTNLFIGSTAGANNNTGNSNLAIGYLAGQNNQTGSRNFQVGLQAGRANIASDNHFVGFFAGTTTSTGSRNTFEGNYAGVYNTTGNNNTALGYEVAKNNTSGNSNTLVGFRAGESITTGSNNTALGYQAGPSSGTLTNATAIGYSASVSQSNALVLGGTGANAVQVGIGTTAPTSTLTANGTVAVGVSNNFAGGSQAAPLALSTNAATYMSLQPNAAANSFFQLPAAASCVGRIYYFCNVGSVAANLVSASTGTLASAFVMPTNSVGRMVLVISDGVNWTIGTIN
jgi:hypothetical protein